VEGAAALLGVSTSTIYHLARQGKIPATRVGREWRFARQNLVQWVINSGTADQLELMLGKVRSGRRRSEA
jgi:excisionase family DNA binding protein